MITEQVILVLATVSTFVLCCWCTRVFTGYLSDVHWIFAETHTAFAFMDPQVIATFVAGLCCTLVIMYLFGAFSGTSSEAANISRQKTCSEHGGMARLSPA